MTAADLQRILDLWPDLDAVPTGKRRNLPRERTTEQRELARQRWEDELTDKQAGAIGRGASPAPCDLDQLQAGIDIAEELCALADRVASRTQHSAPPTRTEWYWHISLAKGVPSKWRVRATPPDPGRWDYGHSHGAPWAVTWLLGALERGVPALVTDDIARTAHAALRRLTAALDGQTERNAGRCPCGTPLKVADWDDRITCPTCHTTYGRRDWLWLRDFGKSA